MKDWKLQFLQLSGVVKRIYWALTRDPQLLKLTDVYMAQKTGKCGKKI